MAASILEALQNADVNLRNKSVFGLAFAKEQLHNAVTLLNKGYSLDEEVKPLLEGYEFVEDVPEKQNEWESFR